MGEKALKSYTSIGGQALIEGVMMRGNGKIGIAVRKPDGDIELKMEKPLGLEKSFVTKVPVLRGIFALIGSMIVGVRALTYSAEFYIEDEAAEKGRFEQFLYDKLGKKADDVFLGLSIVFAFVFAMLLFGALPTGVVGIVKRFIDHPVALSAIEGVMKILIFMLYIGLIGHMRDIKRVFQYHGAEHKTIHCYESGKEVTVENAKTFTTLHPRCGTSFVFFVMAISIALFTFLSWESVLIRILTKLLLFPLVAGLSYEMIRLAGKSNHPIVRILSKPGMMMQKLTTKEPDDAQLEVAIAAFLSVLNEKEMQNEQTAG